MPFLIEMLIKSNHLLNLVGAEGKTEEFKILEMSLNREDIMRK